MMRSLLLADGWPRPTGEPHSIVDAFAIMLRSLVGEDLPTTASRTRDNVSTTSARPRSAPRIPTFAALAANGT